MCATVNSRAETHGLFVAAVAFMLLSPVDAEDAETLCVTPTRDFDREPFGG